MDTPIPENPPAPPRRSSKSRSLIKWAAISGSILLMLLIAIALLLTYFFPSDFVRKELETQGSEILQGIVRVDSLSFNLLTGLELKNVEFSQKNEQILQFERLNLDYSFLELLRGQLKINEIAIEQADVSLDLPEMASAQSTREEQPLIEPSPESTVSPYIPVSINLHSLAIRDSNVDLIINPTIAIALKALNVDISGEADKDVAALAGKMHVAQLAIDMDKKHLRLPLGINFSIDTILSDQHLNLEQLTIHSDSHIQLSLTGRLDQYFGNPDIDLSLHDSHLDLKKILLLIHDFLPPEMTNIGITGVLSPTVGIKGSMDDSGFRGKLNATIQAQKLSAEAPQFSTHVADTDLSLVISDLTINENIPEFGSVKLDLSNRQSQYDNYLVRDLTLSSSTDYFAVGPVTGKIKTTGISSIPAIGEVQPLTLPFNIQVDAKGNYKTQDMTINNLTVRIKDFLTLQAQGGVHPQANPLQPFRVSVDARLVPQLNHILPLVPKHYLEGLTIHKGAEPDVLTLNITGAVKKDYTPQWAKASSSIKLMNVTGELNDLALQGTAKHMNVLLSTGYNAISGQIGGTVGIALQASNLQQGETAIIGSTDLKLKSTFLGHTTPDWKLTDFRSQEILKIHLGDFVGKNPSLQTTLDQMTISAKTKEDIFKKDYVLEHLRITSDELLDVSVKGRYRMNKKEFSVHSDVPFLKVGNLLNRLSGDLVHPVKGLKPSGTISMSLKASGIVPEPDDIESLALPFKANISVTLQDVEGAFAKHQIRGANGTVGASLTPGDHPLVKVASDLRVNKIQLSPDLPITHLSQVLTSFNIFVDDFNDIRLNEVKLGIEGADLSLHGNVTGIKDFVHDNADPATILENLFAQIQTKASVDLSNFQGLLKQYGIKGSGQSQVDLSFSKKKKGPLDVKLNLGATDMSMTQGTTIVTNVDGKITLQKRLEWNSSNPRLPITNSFNPTNVLTRLRSITGKQKSLKIDRVDLGYVSLSNFSTHLLFNGNALKMQNLAMNLLGGGLGGDIVLTTGKTFGTSARLEAAQLDLNHLLTDDLKISGDSLVDATVGLSVFFEEATNRLDLRRTEMNLFITHIGKEAVDRLLVFLDPEGSNPTLVSARSQVRLANPSRVTMKMARGMLGLEILFSEGLLPPFTLDRFPIGRLKNLQTVTQKIPNWEMITKMMALIGAQTYGVDENGNILIQ